MPNPTYSVALTDASFSSPDTAGLVHGDFRFTLFINNDAQAQLALSAEATNSSPVALIQQAQGQLVTALKAWAANLTP